MVFKKTGLILLLTVCLADINYDYAPTQSTPEEDGSTVESPQRTSRTNSSDLHEVLARRTFIDNCCSGETTCPGLSSLEQVRAFADTRDGKMMDSLRMATKYSRSRIITLQPYKNLIFAIEGPTTPFHRQLTPRMSLTSTTRRRRRRTSTTRLRRRRRTTTPYYDYYYDDTTTAIRRRRRSTTKTTPAYYDDYYYDEKTTRRRRTSTSSPATSTLSAKGKVDDYYDYATVTRRRRRRTSTKAPEYYYDDYYDAPTTRRRRSSTSPTATTLGANNSTITSSISAVSTYISLASAKTILKNDNKEETSQSSKSTNAPQVDDSDP
ncbi:uncharacterized protein LOC132192719 [Neocloeon triangulifer]|uniref:uncharacterized protein LOC132192719 n=1 Tax=Neocloeon triangulifer TaxID=2078957 RepID=UPI00286F18A1|nr:uncharacterized protein LOC132192719 [Neocloeon triangulifer]